MSAPRRFARRIAAPAATKNHSLHETEGLRARSQQAGGVGLVRPIAALTTPPRCRRPAAFLPQKAIVNQIFVTICGSLATRSTNRRFPVSAAFAGWVKPCRRDKQVAERRLRALSRQEARAAPSECLQEKANNRESLMAAYLIFDVEIHDMARYQEYMARVKPALEAAGARYLARGGAAARAA